MNAESLVAVWCPGTELNCRHGDFQSPALPTELPGPKQQKALYAFCLLMSRKNIVTGDMNSDIPENVLDQGAACYGSGFGPQDSGAQGTGNEAFLFGLIHFIF